MFSAKVITFTSPALLRKLMACSLLLSGLVLAGTDETHSGTGTKSNKNVIAKVEHPDRNDARKITEATPAKTSKNGPRTPSASAIRSIKVAKDEQHGGALLATIELDGQPQYTHFTLPSPYRLVIDVQNVSTTMPNVIPVGVDDLKRVRLGKMDEAVRIVFDAAKPQPYEISDEGSVIRVWFGAPKTTPTKTEAKRNEAPANAVKPLPASTPPAQKAAVLPQPKLSATAAPNAAPKSSELVANHSPILKAKPVQLPASPKNVVKIIKPRMNASASTLRLLPPATVLLGKNQDAPPPLKLPNTGTKATALTRSNLPVPAGDTPAKAVRNEPEKASTPSSSPIIPSPPSPRPREVIQTGSAPQGKSFNVGDYAKPDFVGEPINLDLRSTQGKTVDIRDFLRFISDTYKVNFVLDQSVRDTPITVSLQNVPWNQAMDALLRANRLGIKVEGSILRVMSQETIALEDRIRQDQVKARQDATPLVTEMVRLNYARALTGAASGGSSGGGASSASSSSSGGASSSGAGSTAGGSGLDGIIRSRLSQRGNIQADPRTNTLVITDLPENIVAIKEIIAKLDVPEPQVEIESRIVIANRNFARDLGVQIGATVINGSQGSQGTFSTLPGSVTLPAGTEPKDSLRAAGAASILSLTTGLIGTARISAVLSAAETKGNVKTISSPRITALNNQTANIVNGVQIPVQTESNNTLTVTFVTAALRLEITPQINDNGNVLLKVVAENNSVNTAIATTAAPGINTQRAETTVLVPDGGTTIIGGINIDVESNAQQRTPGISRVPGLGELFKRRTVSRQTDEILFFITPRIYRPLATPNGMTTDMQK